MTVTVVSVESRKAKYDTKTALIKRFLLYNTITFAISVSDTSVKILVCDV